MFAKIIVIVHVSLKIEINKIVYLNSVMEQWQRTHDKNFYCTNGKPSLIKCQSLQINDKTVFFKCGHMGNEVAFQYILTRKRKSAEKKKYKKSRI
jgi:hypothetical protein